MNIQYINISKVTNLDYYIKKYGFDKNELTPDPFAVEIREISQTEKLFFELILYENKVKYFFSEKNNFQESIFICGHYSNLLKIFQNSQFLIEEQNYLNINKVLKNYLTYNTKTFNIREHQYSFASVYVMGIINVTPDSFSDGGKFFLHDAAVKKAIEMLNSGVDIIDVGGESTRPGAENVDAATEIERIVPVIKEIISKRPDAIISVDTAKSKVAALAIEAGASIINDVSAFAFDEEIIDVANNYNVPYILMHMKGIPRTMQNNPFYEDAVNEIYDFFLKKIRILKKKGVEKIIIDPGIGFGKRVTDNMEIIRRLSELKGIGFPILIGLSRKSFIGKILNLDVGERDIPTIIEETSAINNGATFIRTHNTNNALQIKKLYNYKNQLETAVK